MNKKKSITIYSSPACPYCDQVKNYLTEKDINFQEINLSEQPEKAEELVKKTGQMGVPVTMIKKDQDEEEIIIGFDIDKINSALGL